MASSSNIELNITKNDVLLFIILSVCLFEKKLATGFSLDVY
jgi:hypothetical protein